MTKKLFLILSLIVVLVIILAGSNLTSSNQRILTVFYGSASKPAMDEVAQAFEKKTGIKVYSNFGGSGTMLSQMKISKSGDLYIPGSPDYMLQAQKDGVIDAKSVEIIAYLIPAILVQEGNPKNILVLSDLAKPAIKAAIADPQSVSVGLYAYEILEHNDFLEDVGKNIVAYTESYSKLAALVALDAVDAILGWRVFSEWHSDTIDAVYLKPEQIPRLSYISGAISTFSENREQAQEFLDFLTSSEGQKFFDKHRYIATESEAKSYAPNAEIGGQYILPETYRPLVR
jgi:molybdate transport system substrate-binding protein